MCKEEILKRATAAEAAAATSVEEVERKKKWKKVSERVFCSIMNGSAVSIVKRLDSMTQTNNEQI